MKQIKKSSWFKVIEKKYNNLYDEELGRPD
jgi:hypothetical protein